MENLCICSVDGFAEGVSIYTKAGVVAVGEMAGARRAADVVSKEVGSFEFGPSRGIDGEGE